MKISKKITLALCSAGLLASAAATAVVALPNEAFEVIYFSNPSKTNVVGGLEYYCGSRFYSWGERTSYRTRISYGPC
ncbi:DUF6289 family protein [Woodsholea maritima]|uniref:DUF6289 family protein n=1 Tax=Woodsholea maritima TaxID=240237 RepID=UPI0003A7FD5B|nr:DUF6289 family protein [Woodsholea maritima]